MSGVVKIETEPAGSDAPRRADAVRNREAVIKAAEEVFGEQGIEAGVPDVAERAGVGKGTVYRNFETKDELVAAVLTARQQRFTAQVQVALEKDDAWLAFRDLLQETVRGKMKNGSFGFGLKAFEENEALATERKCSHEHLGSLMKKAKKQGAMRKDAQPDDVSVLFGGICRILDEREIDDPKIWRRHVDHVVDAFRTQPS